MSDFIQHGLGRWLHIFSGVGAVEDIGYEPHPSQFSITA